MDWKDFDGPSVWKVRKIAANGEVGPFSKRKQKVASSMQNKNEKKSTWRYKHNASLFLAFHALEFLDTHRRKVTFCTTTCFYIENSFPTWKGLLFYEAFYFCFRGTVFFTSFSLTKDGLNSHPQVAPHVAFLIDNGDPVYQRNRIHQIRQIHHSSSDQSKPKKKAIIWPLREMGWLRTMETGHKMDPHSNWSLWWPCLDQAKRERLQPHSGTFPSSIPVVVWKIKLRLAF